jgi:hypothetical protein
VTLKDSGLRSQIHATIERARNGGRGHLLDNKHKNGLWRTTSDRHRCAATVVIAKSIQVWFGGGSGIRTHVTGKP